MVTTWRQHRQSPILGFQESDVGGRLSKLVIDPSKLKVCALLCETSLHKSLGLVMAEDIVHADQKHFIVNSFADIVSPDDVLRLQPLIQLKYSPLGKGVYTASGKRLGVVLDFSFDTEQWYIHKLHVRPGLLGSIDRSKPYIDRRQIIEITAHKIIVQDTRTPVRHFLSKPFGLNAGQNPSA